MSSRSNASKSPEYISIDSAPQHDFNTPQAAERVGLSEQVDWKPVILELCRHFPIPVAALGYTAHRLYRRYIPRKWPPFTPLRLAGVYLLLGGGMEIAMRSLYATKRMYEDDDLAIIAFATVSPPQKTLQLWRESRPPMGVESPFRRIREEVYYSGGLLEKLKWWSLRLWYDPAEWDGWATLLYSRNRDVDPTWQPQYPSDLNACISQLAVQNSKRTEDYTMATLIALLASVPLSMLARRSGRRMLYLPMNGLQRMLLGGCFAIEAVWMAQFQNSFTDIKDKHGMAIAFHRLLGPDYDDEIEGVKKVFAMLP
ncbi:hypothetical protein C8Q76DRAFT_295194 [Earliella scabrosa]|nr:hypothetical protein C8Q76DRAFT_295194 [Earliella scabrosa]